jgi:hypothetical protein
MNRQSAAMNRRGLRKFREQVMAKRTGMQKLKQQFVGKAVALPVMTTPILAEIDVIESGTYPTYAGERAAADAAAEAMPGEVTLVVYGWQNVQPGTLSWVFPSFAAAMKAAGALRNATQWAIVDGSDATGQVLAERS